MSFVALYENALDFATAGIYTPVRSNRLWNCLEGYPNRMQIYSGFRDGFRIGITLPFNRDPVKKQQKYINLNELANKLNTELENGRILARMLICQLKTLLSTLCMLSRSLHSGYSV